MVKVTSKKSERIKKRVRSKIIGKTPLLRLSVYRSNKHIYVQAIDDQKKKTVAHVSDQKIADLQDKITKTEKAQKIGVLLADKLKKIGINKAVFDRSSYKYAGRVKAICEGVREGGITI